MEPSIDLREKALALEYTLMTQYRPSFISFATDEEDNHIHFIMSSSLFKNKKRKDMIREVYDTLIIHNFKIMEDTTVYIETYTGPEFAEVLNYML